MARTPLDFGVCMALVLAWALLGRELGFVAYRSAYHMSAISKLYIY